ncbi:hypothetical protein EXS74_01740 [Candidatus Woesearchaeota archaeon]|nr:hypothetical protein [Candidatus Woesearchaeota archaeon]
MLSHKVFEDYLSFFYIILRIVFKGLEYRLFMIPYFKQEKSWSCGAACFRMILASFGIRKTEKQMIKLLRTNGRYGTRNKAFPLAAETLGFSYRVERNANISELRKAYSDGYALVVNYYLFDEKMGHLGVIDSITSKQVILLDPWHGKKNYSFSSFLKAWYTIDPSLADAEKGWFFGVKNKSYKDKKE